jgi:hypothetical protein
MAKRRPGSIERRGGSFRVRLCVAGARHYFTLPATDKSVAERFAREKARELERRAARAAAGFDVVSFGALLDTYEKQELPTLAPGARRSYEDCLKPIRQ